MIKHSAESDTRTLVKELELAVMGEVRFDKMTRHLYSTDASIYQIEPIGVVIPKDSNDVIAVIETASRYGIPVLPRGGGTSLAGQTVGHAIVVDFSKYMRHIQEVNLEEGWVRTQPGIVLDELNHHLARYSVQFAPDPSTSNRGNVGGALGNNSCGAHSIMWGKTVDNVHSLDVILANGKATTMGPIDSAGMTSKLHSEGLEGAIYQKLSTIGQSNRQAISDRYPKIQRRVSGYNLDELVNDGPFNMARFVIGSEGTLVTITEAKLKVVAVPKLKGLVVLHCKELIESMEATVAALEMNPSAVELIGSMIIQQAKSNLTYSRITNFINGDPEALLLIEVYADSDQELRSKLDKIKERMEKGNWGYSTLILTKPEDQARVWNVRKAGLGLMMNVPGDAKPIPFVEDTAVAPEVLPEFIHKFDRIVQKYGTQAGYYGHASVGCLHIRPLINLKHQEGVDRMVAISEEISDLVLQYGGSMSGEHGDGLVRSPFNEKMFGPQIYSAFQDVKRAFDPKGIMNPGKVVNAQPITNDLRIGPSYSVIHPDTVFSYGSQSSFAGAIEMCNGQGECRKVLEGTMCPSYIATREEEHSTRGRANALRGAISGALPSGSLTSKRLYSVLDLCLECKGCKAECPSNVDMAKLKYEFLSLYHRESGQPLRNKLFGNIGTFSKLGSFLAPLSNWALKSESGRQLMARSLGIDTRRTLPSFAKQTFLQWFKSRGGSPDSNAKLGRVVLFPDTFTNYNHPNLGIDAVAVLEKLGYQVIIPRRLRCCGRPMLSKGMLDKAKNNARFNVTEIHPYIATGAKLVGLEPSCILSFLDDYTDLLSGCEKASQVSQNTMLIEEFFLYAKKQGANPRFLDASKTQKALVHGHCHQKALVGTSPALEVLNSIPGIEASDIKSGCCGMAGSFGFETEHYDISMKIGEHSLLPKIRSQGENTLIISEGVSCRQQIVHGTGVEAKHLVEVLAERLTD